jgi:hypothetical protein
MAVDAAREGIGEVLRVAVSQADPPERGAAGEVGAGLDAGRGPEDLVLERVQHLLEPLRVQHR